MKKLIALLLSLICLLGLIGCSNKSMNYIVANEPNITGIVKEANENAILIENEKGEYWVSLNVENKDSTTHFNLGDEVVVYYNGNIAESYPMQINTVYAITLKEPADRAENNREAVYVNITAEEAKQIMDSEEGYVILDVRTQEEYDQGHIPGAILIPDTEVEVTAEDVLTDKDQLILVYCRSGRRSKLAAEALVELGYTNIKEFGGIIDWPYEVEKDG